MSKRLHDEYEGVSTSDYIRQRVSDGIDVDPYPNNFATEPIEQLSELPQLLKIGGGGPAVKRVYKKKYRKGRSISYLDLLSGAPRRTKRKVYKKKYVKARKPVRRPRRVSGPHASASCSCGHSPARKSYKSVRRVNPFRRR